MNGSSRPGIRGFVRAGCSTRPTTSASRRSVFSPDSKLLVTTSGDRTARLWRAADGKPLHVLDQPDGHVVGADFSPDGTKIVTASDGGTARVWDVATGGRLLVLVGPTNPITGASFSSDGQFIVVASLDRTARVYRSDNGLQARSPPRAHGRRHRGDFQPGRSASRDGEPRRNRSRLESRNRERARARRATTATPIRAADLSPNGRLAVAGDVTGLIRTWDVEKREGVYAQKPGGCVDTVGQAQQRAFLRRGWRSVHVDGVGDEVVRLPAPGRDHGA